jgi:hypothetical protein
MMQSEGHETNQVDMKSIASSCSPTTCCEYVCHRLAHLRMVSNVEIMHSLGLKVRTWAREIAGIC